MCAFLIVFGALGKDIDQRGPFILRNERTGEIFRFNRGQVVPGTQTEGNGQLVNGLLETAGTPDPLGYQVALANRFCNHLLESDISCGGDGVG